MSGPSATFRLSSGDDLTLVVTLQQAVDATLAADIAFRFSQRLSLASAERLDRLFGSEASPSTTPAPVVVEAARVEPIEAPLGLTASPLARPPIGRLLDFLSRSPAPFDPQPTGPRGLTGDD